jgi:hypothetical protein
MCPLNETNKVLPKKSVNLDSSRDGHVKNNLQNNEMPESELLNQTSQGTSVNVMLEVMEEPACASGTVEG